MPEHMPRLLRPTQSFLLLGVGLALVSAAMAAAVTRESLQAGVGLVIVLLLVGAYVHDRRVAFLGLWAVWLVTPGLRRVLVEVSTTAGPDPLSVVPFVATGALGLLEASRVRPDRRTTRIVGLAAIGLAIGVPMGAANPQGLVFAALAYGSAVLMAFAGFAEGRAGSISLRTALLVGGPLVGFYGVIQYVAVPSWDADWLRSVALVSIGTPDQFRVFSTLNSPGPLANVLGLALLCVLAARLSSLRSLIVAVPLLAAIALTSVRGSWVSLLIAALSGLALLPRRTQGRLLGLVALGTVLLVAFAASPAGQSFTNRVSTVSEGSSDDSAAARLDRFRLIPTVAAGNPIGEGLGQAGVATSLSADQGGSSPGLDVAGGDAQRDTDNGVLSLVLQTGPVGAACVLGALLWGTAVAVRTARRRRRTDAADALVAMMLVFIVTQEVLFGDALYGVTGAFAWYLVGVGLGRARRTRPLPAIRSAAHG